MILNSGSLEIKNSETAAAKAISMGSNTLNAGLKKESQIFLCS